jgi:hypothetical protein
MDTTTPVRVELLLRPAVGTIAGRVAVGDAPATEFYGWLELIDRVGRAAPGGAAPAAPNRGPRADE